MVLGCKQQGGDTRTVHALGNVVLHCQAQSQNSDFDLKALVAKEQGLSDAVRE